MADLRDVLAGQLATSDRLPEEGECRDDPFVMDLDDHQWNGNAGYLPRHYVRCPMEGQLVPPMVAVDLISRFASSVMLHGRRVIFVSAHPVPRSMCAARTLQLTIGGTIQGALLLVNQADEGVFKDDRVLDVIIALGGGAK